MHDLIMSYPPHHKISITVKLPAEHDNVESGYVREKWPLMKLARYSYLNKPRSLECLENKTKK